SLLRVTRCCEHRWVGYLYQVHPAKAVEAAAQAGAVSPELAEFDPIALADVSGQAKGSAHAVGAVAGRPEQGKIGELLRVSGFTEPDAAGGEAEAKRAGIAQATIDPVVDE